MMLGLFVLLMLHMLPMFLGLPVMPMMVIVTSLATMVAAVTPTTKAMTGTIGRAAIVGAAPTALLVFVVARIDQVSITLSICRASRVCGGVEAKEIREFITTGVVGNYCKAGAVERRVIDGRCN